MRIYISADIEGITGVVNWKQAGTPSSDHYDYAFARRMMTHDVNAAIRGARDAGATKIVIKDSHNVGLNLLIDQLEPGVELISGSRACPDGMMQGISRDFDACFLIGYHGMAGATEGVMEHTITGRIHRVSVNGQPIGEMGMSAATAGYYGVPLVMVSSDDKGCHEAKSFIPTIEAAQVKVGMGRFMSHLLHPSETVGLIHEAARRGVDKASSIPPYTLEGECTARLEFNRSEEVDEASQLPGWNRLDAYTIEQTFPDWPSAHIGMRRAMSFAMLVAL